MADLKDFSEQFEAWWLTKFSAEFLDSDNCWSAWTGWQARGELDVVRIKELEADLDKFHEWVESQSPLALREYIHAQAAWQARGELEAVKINGLEGIIAMQKETIQTLNSCITEKAL
jgi:hypothetical protein